MPHSVQKAHVRVILVLGILVLLCAPLVLFAQSITYTPLEQGVIRTRGIGVGMPAVSLVNDIVKFVLSIITILAVVMLVIGGVQYMMSNVVSSKEEAKRHIWGAVYGLLIAMSIWLILALINPQLLNVGVKTLQLLKPKLSAPGATQVGPGGIGGGPPGSTTCRTEFPPGNYCSGTALGSACGWDARSASAICSQESGGGNTAAGSHSDRMANDPGRRSFSWGLFQINLTVHQIGGLDCPKAFRGRNYGAVVVDEALYAQCVALAKDPSVNTAKACSLWQNAGGTFRDWRNSANTCGVI